MSGWRFDVPDADDRKPRHIVAVVGYRTHSNAMWRRLTIDVAATLYEGRQGYSETDMDRIEECGDMDPGTGRVVAWMDFETPPLLMDTRDLEPLPMPVRAAKVECS
jgi:hypothetical protein